MAFSLLQLTRVALFSCIIISASSSARAGCPYYPPEALDVAVTACTFYAAEKDDAFRAKIDAYFTPGWDNATPEKITEYKSAAMKRNTGAIFTGKVGGGAAEEKLFLLSDDAAACDKFKVPGTHRFGVQQTCKMIFFAAPTSRVLSQPPPDDIQTAVPAPPAAK